MRTRKHPRQIVHTVGFLYTSDGWPLGECTVRDISVGGAKFVHKITDELPGTLVLALSKDGNVRRSCQLVWRKDDQVGVRFVRPGAHHTVR